MIRSKWQLHEAKSKLGEVVRRARSESPQVITERGREVAVVIDEAEFDTRSAGSLVDALVNAPRLFTRDELAELFSRGDDVATADVPFDS